MEDLRGKRPDKETVRTLTVLRVYDSKCEACVEQRVHSEEEWKNHPDRGNGFNKSDGEARPKYREKRNRIND